MRCSEPKDDQHLPTPAGYEKLDVSNDVGTDSPGDPSRFARKRPMVVCHRSGLSTLCTVCRVSRRGQGATFLLFLLSGLSVTRIPACWLWVWRRDCTGANATREGRRLPVTMPAYLYQTLHSFGFASAPVDQRRRWLEPDSGRITNAVKCPPPQNKRAVRSTTAGISFPA